MRISYSSSNTFQGCNRKFFHEKVRKTPADPDYEDNTTALRLGKAFHQVLELALHKKERLKKEFFQSAFDDNDILSDTERGYIRAMVHKYLQLHVASQLEVRVVEVEVGNDDYIGFVDAIMYDSNGNWWIVDLKTAARLNGSLLSRLSRDPQLNVYAHFRGQIARMLSLDADKFAGVRYRVTTKPTIKMSAKESFTDFTKRCFDRVESYDIGIPARELNPDGVYAHFMQLLDRMNEVAEMDEEKIPQNFTYCETYFKPCPFWSRCYGRTFTDAAAQYKIYDTSNIKPLTQDVVEEDELSFL